MRTPLRLEWISLSYLVLFVLAVLSPTLVRGDMMGIPEDHAEEILIFALGVAGLVIFSLYEQLMERREREREEAIRDRDRTRQELVSSYEYIGAVNRQIDSLKQLANDTAVSLVEDDRVRKDLFQSLAASAASLVRSPRASIRVIAFDQLRTIREFHTEPTSPVRVANKELFRAHEDGRSHVFLKDDVGDDVLVVPSDRNGNGSKSFLLIAASPDENAALDHGILKVYANQAELLHHSLEQRRSPSGAPLDLVRAAERQAIGDVS